MCEQRADQVVFKVVLSSTKLIKGIEVIRTSTVQLDRFNPGEDGQQAPSFACQCDYAISLLPAWVFLERSGDHRRLVGALVQNRVSLNGMGEQRRLYFVTHHRGRVISASWSGLRLSGAKFRNGPLNRIDMDNRHAGRNSVRHDVGGSAFSLGGLPIPDCNH